MGNGARRRHCADWCRIDRPSCQRMGLGSCDGLMDERCHDVPGTDHHDFGFEAVDLVRAVDAVESCSHD